MDTFSTVVKFFQDCGLFIYPSALIMALGIAISIERFLFLTKARNQNRKVWAAGAADAAEGPVPRRPGRDLAAPTPRSARSSTTA